MSGRVDRAIAAVDPHPAEDLVRRAWPPPRRDVISAAIELEAKSVEYHRISASAGGPAEARRARALWRVAQWLRKQVSDGK